MRIRGPNPGKAEIDTSPEPQGSLWLFLRGERPEEGRLRFMLALGKVHHSLCEEGLQECDDESIDLVCTSPPYDGIRSYNGCTFCFDDLALQLVRVLKPGGVIVWVVADQVVNGGESGTSFRQALAFQSLGLRIHDTMIYRKKGWPKPDMTRYQPCFEYMMIFSKGRPAKIHLIKDRPNKCAGRVKKAEGYMKRAVDGSLIPMFRSTKVHITEEYGYRSNIWEYNTGHKNTAHDPFWTQHPSVYPLALARDHIRSWSDPGDVVLDPFMGSGQTAIAAELEGRQWLGLECSAEYCRLARKRLKWYRENYKEDEAKAS